MEGLRYTGVSRTDEWTSLSFRAHFSEDFIYDYNYWRVWVTHKIVCKSIDVKENDGFQNVIGFNFSNFSEQLDTYVET